MFKLKISLYYPFICCSPAVGLWSSSDHVCGSEGGAVWGVCHTQLCSVPGGVWVLHCHAHTRDAQSCKTASVRQRKSYIVVLVLYTFFNFYIFLARYLSFIHM